MTNVAATVDSDVWFTFITNRNAPYLDIDTGHWTFQLIHHDGWQICTITTPPLCDTVIYCTPAPPTGNPYASSRSSALLYRDGTRYRIPYLS